MDEAPRSLHREALPPRSRNGIYGPIAAMATVMMMSIASLAIVVAPQARRERAREHRIEAVRVVGPRRAAPVVAPRSDALCRGPVYRAGPDGTAEMVYEVCAGAPLPRVILRD